MFQPPRRSYTDSPRLKKVVFEDSVTHDETTTDDEKENKEKTIRTKSKPKKKYNKTSKKEVCFFFHFLIYLFYNIFTCLLC